MVNTMTYKLSCDFNDVAPLLSPARLRGRDELLADWRVVPATPGLYAVWSDIAFDGMNSSSLRCDGFALAYVGRAGGKGQGALRHRLRQHLRGRCASSTLRRALAALLRKELGLQPALSSSGKLQLIGDGEDRLSGWLSDHARISWMTHSDPAALERALIHALSPPLNIEGAPRVSTLKKARVQLLQSARALG